MGDTNTFDMCLYSTDTKKSERQKQKERDKNGQKQAETNRNGTKQNKTD